jgi:very-short-patch-repair endonuclease
MDLYRAARQFPFTLRGSGIIVCSADLPMTMNAARWRAGRRDLTRIYRGCYVLSPEGPDLLDRCRATLTIAPRAVIGFHTAAALLGFGVVESEAIHVVLPQGTSVPQQPGIVSHGAKVAVPPVVFRGVACTAPTRTAIDLARVLPRAQALTVLDASLANGACTPEGLMAELALHQGLKGYRRASELVPLANGRSQCAQETHLRLIIHDADLTTFQPQWQVLDRYGDVRYVIDMAERELRIAAEYDGVSHLDRGRLRSDRTRHNYLSTRHWRMRYFTDHDLYRCPEGIATTLRAAMADARLDPTITQSRS